MAVISWKYNTDGSWSNAANWSGGALPGAADDVMLATLSPHTITHSSGNDQIHNLTATTDSLAITGGTLSISGTASFGQNLQVSAGTLSLQGTSASVGGSFTGTSGQILLGSGTALTLNGTSTFGTSNVSYGTEIDGPGTISTLGTTNIAATYYNGMVLGNGVTWDILATVNDTGGIYLGDGNGLGATLVNAAGVSFNLTSDNADIVNGYQYNAHGQQVYGTSTFSNAGTFTKTAGTGTTSVASVFTNTGVITAASGTLEFDGGGSFGGTLSGAGQIAFGGGTATIATGAGLTVASLLFDGATAAFTGSLTTTGSVSLSNGSLTLANGSADSIANFSQYGYYGDHLNLNGSTLTSGNAFLGSGYLEGPGTLTVSGTTTLSGWNDYTYSIGGGATIANTGTINQGYYTYVDYGSGAGFTISNKAGATYNITGDFSLGANNQNGIGSTFSNAGTFAKSGGTGISQVVSTFNNTGTVNAASGTLEFDGGGTIGGSLTGTSVLAFAAGTYTLSAGLSIKAGEMLFDGATVTLGANETFTSAQLAETNGTILLAGHTLTTTSAFLGGGAITGAGTITTAGSTTLSGNNGGGVLYLGGGVNLVNSGVVNQAYYLYVNPPTGAGFTITNKAGATYNLTGNFNLGGNSYNGIGSAFVNAGTFAKTAGTGTTNVYSAFTNTGTISSAIGNLEFDNGGTFGGVLSGAGTISFANNATYTLSAGTTVTVANLDEYTGSTVLNLGENLNYTGLFTYNGGYINLGGHTLTLTGANLINGTFDGAGSVSLKGTTALATNSNFYFGNQAVITNTGTVDQNGTLYVGGTQNGGNDFSVINQAGATWDLTNLYYVGYAAASGNTTSFTNAGTFSLTGGTGYTLVYSNFTNTGAITATTAEIAFEGGGVFGGTITSAGLISFQNNSYSLGGLNAAAASSVEFYQSTLNLTANVSLGGALLANGSGSTINLAGDTLSVNMFDLAHAGATQSFEQAGTLSTTGAGSIVDWYSNGVMVDIGGGGTWVNSGTMADGGLVQLGDNNLTNGNASGTLVNQAAGVFDLTSDDASIQQGSYTSGPGTQVSSGAVIINAGTLAKTGGTLTSHIYGTLTSTGTLATTTGTLELDRGGTLSGLIADGSTITLAGGAFSFGALTIGGGSAVSNSVTIDASTKITLGDSSSMAATFTNNGLYRLDTNIGIAAGGSAGSVFVNTSTGTLAKTGGTGSGTIAAAVVNSGTILASAGTLDLTGSVTGTGVLDIGAGAILEIGAKVAATQGIAYTGTTGTLTIDSIAGAKQTISGLTAGDAIDLTGVKATSAVVNGSDQLVISNGSTVVAQLQLAGSYLSDGFTVVSDGNGGSLITLSTVTTAWQGGSADWFTANAWTNGPPDAQTNATIAQTGTYTVTLNNGEVATADTLVLNAPSASFNFNGTLNITQSIALTAGTLSLGGTINGGVLAANGGTINFNNDVLNNVSYQGTLNLTNNYNTLSTTGSFAIAGAGGTGAGVINLTGYQAYLYEYGYQTLTNATLNIGSSTSGTSFLRSYDSNGQGAILTLGAGLNIVHAGTNANIGDSGNSYDAVYNAGTITAALSGGTLTMSGNDFENDGIIAVSNGDDFAIRASSFVNTGKMTVNGASLDVYGSLQNTGTLTATNATLNMHGALTGAQLTSLASGGGDTLNLSGTLDEGNGTLSVGTGAKIVALNLSGEIENAVIKPTAGAFTFLNGATLDNVTYAGTMSVGGGVAVTLDDTLKGATIADAGGGILFGNNVILSGDTYQGTLSLLSGNAVSVTGGLTLQGQGGTGAGAINATAGAAQSILYFLDNETLSNVTITSGSGTAGTQGLFLAPVAPSAGTLTLAASSVFHVLANTTAGLFSVSPTTGQPLGDKFINNGQIIVDAGASFLGADGSLGSVTNAGTISLGAGAIWGGAVAPLTSAAFTNTAAGLITLGTGASFTSNGGSFANNGSITLGTNALATIQGNWSETGTTTLATGASFDIFGSMTFASLAGISGAGTLGIDGALNLAGNVFNMATAGRPTNVQIGGDVSNGTFVNSAGTLTFGTLATLDTMIWKGALSIGAGSTVDIVNGITLQTVNGATPGNINLNNGGTIDFESNTVLDNVVVTSTSPSAGTSSPGLADSLDIGVAGGTLTLGANFTLNAKSGATIFADTAAAQGGTLINNGQINVMGGAVWLDSSFASMTNASTITLASNTEFDPTPTGTGASNFTNSGLVSLAGLDDFDVSGNGANSGAITVGTASEVSFGGSFANSGTITLAQGGSLTAAGGLTNTGAIIASGATSEYVIAQAGTASAFNNGTLSGSGLWEVTANSTLTLDMGSALTVDASDIVLSGAGSVLRSVEPTVARIESTLATITAAGTLALLAGRNYTAMHTISDAGVLQLQGGTLNGSALTITAAGELTGSGTVGSTIANAGTIDAHGGTLTLSAAATGAGLLQIDAGSELILGAANAETVLFNSSSSELRLNTPTSFTGTLSGYGAGDQLLLMSTNGTAASISGTSLTVTLSGGSTETFKLAATHAAQTLTVTSDGSGDTLVTYPAGQMKAAAAPAMHFIAPATAASLFAPLDAVHLALPTVDDWGGGAAATAGAPAEIFAAKDITAALHGSLMDLLSPANQTHSQMMLSGRV